MYLWEKDDRIKVVYYLWKQCICRDIFCELKLIVRKGARPDRVIQHNCGEVRTRTNHKTTRTWENFHSRGTKMILLWDKLWLIANKSKGFANRSNIRNNLGNLFRTCKNIVMDLIVWNIDLACKKYIKEKCQTN